VTGSVRTASPRVATSCSNAVSMWPKFSPEA
jgi:hypothetical protein